MKKKNKRKSQALAWLAALFTSGEVIVNLGIELPGSVSINPWVRIVVIFCTVGGSYYFKRRQAQEDKYDAR